MSELKSKGLKDEKGYKEKQKKSRKLDAINSQKKKGNIQVKNNVKASKMTLARSTKKPGLHPRNPHNGRYQFDELCLALPRLHDYVIANPKGDKSIDFSNSDAVMCLNMALLAHYYQVQKWQIPQGYLCPPIPGRADYIHYLADVLAEDNSGDIPKGDSVRALDIGVGANCIYPIIGSQSYGWKFVGADIDPVSIKAAKTIVETNSNLSPLVSVIIQPSAQNFFKGIIKKEDRFMVTLCNPPFHASRAEAEAGTRRKLQNLAKNRTQKQNALKKQNVSVVHELAKDRLNFGGQKAELWCKGGERAFLRGMIRESKDFTDQVCWFTSLVSKSENVQPLRTLLAQMGALEVKVISMSQGQKISRLIAWTYLPASKRREFVQNMY